MASLKDARERFLTPKGVLIPRRDVLKAATTESGQFYESLVAPWNEAVEIRALDYTGDANSNASTKLILTANRSGIAHGICVWFDTELYEEIGFSSGPESPVTIYGELFLPWLELVAIEEGEQICVALHANLVGKDYIWRWETEITGANGAKKTHFRQSTFEGAHISSHTLRRDAVDHIPVLTTEGEAERFLLGAMDGCASLREIGKRAAERFPEVYSSQQEAFERASELARKFSR